MLQERGQYDEAEPLFRRGLAIFEKLYGDAHQSTTGTMYRLANLLEAKGRLDEAEALLRRAVPNEEKVHGLEPVSYTHLTLPTTPYV